MANQFLFVICCVLLASTTKCDNSTSKIDLYIGGFFGVNIKDGAWSSAALIPALEMALDHVNNDSNILVDYRLKYVWRDSKVSTLYIFVYGLSSLDDEYFAVYSNTVEAL